MDTLTQDSAFEVARDVFVLPAWCPVPGMGVLPMSSFLIRGRQPTLVDTGPAPMSGSLRAELEQLLDLSDLRWIWLTHTDPDHVGGVQELLERAPAARVVTTTLGAGKMELHSPLPTERVHLIEPGGSLDIGDRDLVALRPPVYDAPETVAAFDSMSRSLFAADCFGTLSSGPVQHAGDLSADALCDGMLTWAGIDTPWLELVDTARFERSLSVVRDLAPAQILGAHLPPAHGMTDTLLALLERARAAASPGRGTDSTDVERLRVAV